jgi:pyruvate/2-oxoglutarate/acetoin dehydrogenase E1 component
MSKLVYAEELKKAMSYLSSKEDTIFLGQSMEYGVIAIANSIDFIAQEKKIEMPVAENLQMGISTGLAIAGHTPVSVYPRWNFLLLAADQLVNHLDKMSEMTVNQYTPKVIIRVAVGVRSPIDPQEQHVGDFTDGFKKIVKNINIVKLDNAEDILKEYKKAYNRTDGISTILVEEHQFG